MQVQVQQILQQCRYNDYQSVFAHAMNILQNFQELKPNMSRHGDGHTIQTFLELVGSIPVNYKGKNYAVTFIIFFPPYFPTVAPVFRIKNIDVNKFNVNQTYLQDYNEQQGLIQWRLTQQENQSWNVQKNSISLIQGIQGKLGVNFPFFAKSQNQNNFKVQAQKLAYTDQIAKQLQNKVQKDAQELLTKIDADIKEQKSNLDKIQEHKNALDHKEATLNLTEGELNLRYEEIESELNKLNDFIQQNDHKTLNSDTLMNILIPKDDLSGQIIDLQAQLDALSDTTLYLEEGFKDNKIGLNDFLKLTREYGQLEFYAKMELKKCLEYAQTHKV